jgi:CDP-diacylglycerol---glycerol-3-phosphate 3-phosphatidyltransferase
MTLANWLTFLRLLLSPVFVLVFLQPGFWPKVAALAIVVLSELTDAFDGHLARRMGEVTDFGKLLDPLADSVSRISVFIAFMAVELIPWWMVLVFVYRDSLISTMRTVCAWRGEVVAARASGKIKAVVQATAIIAILVFRIASELFPRWIPAGWVDRGAWWLVLAAALYTVYSLYEYVSANMHVIGPASRANPRTDETA